MDFMEDQINLNLNKSFNQQPDIVRLQHCQQEGSVLRLSKLSELPEPISKKHIYITSHPVKMEIFKNMFYNSAISLFASSQGADWLRIGTSSGFLWRWNWNSLFH